MLILSASLIDDFFADPSIGFIGALFLVGYIFDYVYKTDMDKWDVGMYMLVSFVIGFMSSSFQSTWLLMISAASFFIFLMKWVWSFGVSELEVKCVAGSVVLAAVYWVVVF